MEETIRRLLAEQPEKGLELAMKQYMGLCWAVVRAQLAGIGTHEDMEDCVSEAFAALYAAREKLDMERGTIKSFLAVAAKRRAIDCYRRLNRQVSREVTAFQEAADLAQQCVLRETLKAALKELGTPDTEIFLRKYYLGQSTKEIAAILDLKENTVDKKVQRGLLKLRTRLEGGRME